MSAQFRVKKLYPDAKIPCRQYPDDAGWDLHAYLPDGPLTIGPNQRVTLGCGFAMQLDPGYEGQVRPRSGLSTKKGLMLPNSPGTIDASYRGEVKVCLFNLGSDPYTVTHGERIAQMKIAVVPDVELIELPENQELDSSDRGAGGFGSTGKR